MKSTTVELTCDTCGGYQQFQPPYKKEALANYWIFAPGERHFCGRECELTFKKKRRRTEAIEKGFNGG